MPQDTFQQAMERYDEGVDAWRENYERMREDFKFSNPAVPEQWSADAKTKRKGRVMLTLDQTNQFIQQVTNDARQNTPSISVTPGDSLANGEVALELSKRVRSIEYASRAGIAYDTSIEHAARIGLGWLRIVPVMVDRARNWQEARIMSIADPLAAILDGTSREFDGSDAMWGFVEQVHSQSAFRRRWPKAAEVSFATARSGWCDDKTVKVAEYFTVEEKRGNVIVTADPDGRSRVDMTEDEYWEVANKTGVKPRYVANEERVIDRTVKWMHVSGVDVLDETVFPCNWIGLIPVYGHMLWVEGKRYVCGLTRRLMDGQRFHNIEMSALAEHLQEQPKAPFMAPARAIEGHEQHWKALDNGNPSYLPYNDLDITAGVPDGLRTVSAPQRLGPPSFPAAYAQAAQMGVQAMQSGVGMFKSNLGQQSNAVSGRAKMADKIEGDTATFHYVDNQRRSLEHAGRMLLDMERRLVDTRRTLRTMSLDDKAGAVVVDPEAPEAFTPGGGGQPAVINPTRGEYDVRVRVGPGYTTVREQLKDRLTELGQTNPMLAAALAPLLIKLDDLPEADKIMRVCLALLPPPVQQAYQDDDSDEGAIPPAAQAQITALRGQLEQAAQMLQQMQAQLQEAQQAGNDGAVKAQEVQVKGVEAEAKLLEAQADMVRAQAEAETMLAAPAEQGDQVGALVQALGALVATLQQSNMQTAEAVVALAEGQASAQDQLAQLAGVAAAPRVATLQFDEAGHPVGAVSEVQAP